jgi:hypothetical protein
MLVVVVVLVVRVAPVVLVGVATAEIFLKSVRVPQPVLLIEAVAAVAVATGVHSEQAGLVAVPVS